MIDDLEQQNKTLSKQLLLAQQALEKRCPQSHATVLSLSLSLSLSLAPLSLSAHFC